MTMLKYSEPLTPGEKIQNLQNISQDLQEKNDELRELCDQLRAELAAAKAEAGRLRRIKMALKQEYMRLWHKVGDMRNKTADEIEKLVDTAVPQDER